MVRATVRPGQRWLTNNANRSATRVVAGATNSPYLSVLPQILGTQGSEGAAGVDREIVSSTNWNFADHRIRQAIDERTAYFPRVAGVLVIRPRQDRLARRAAAALRRPQEAVVRQPLDRLCGRLHSGFVL